MNLEKPRTIGSREGNCHWFSGWHSEASKKKTIDPQKSPKKGGGWAKVPLQVGAAGDWLRFSLKVHDMRNGRHKVATHSCKTTLLSEAAKYGIDGRSRRILGYHTASKDKSLIVYSRDEMAGPLRKLVDMINGVKTSRFFPDRTRSKKCFLKKINSTSACGILFGMFGMVGCSFSCFFW